MSEINSTDIQVTNGFIHWYGAPSEVIDLAKKENRNFYVFTVCSLGELIQSYSCVEVIGDYNIFVKRVRPEDIEELKVTKENYQPATGVYYNISDLLTKLNCSHEDFLNRLPEISERVMKSSKNIAWLEKYLNDGFSKLLDLEQFIRIDDKKLPELSGYYSHTAYFLAVLTVFGSNKLLLEARKMLKTIFGPVYSNFMEDETDLYWFGPNGRKQDENES